MKKTTLIILTAISPVVAADYQLELMPGYTHIEEKEHSTNEWSGYESYNSSADATYLGFTYHLESIATKNVPLADAGFLAKSSRVYGNFERQRWDEVENKNAEVGFIGFVTEQQFVGVSYVDENINYGIYQMEESGLGVALGHYFSDLSSVTLSYQNMLLEIDAPFFHFDKEGRERYTLHYKHIVMNDNVAKQDIEITANKNDEEISLQSHLGWYHGNRAKVGVIVGAISPLDGALAHYSYGFWGEWFFSEKLALNAQYLVAAGQESRFSAMIFTVMRRRAQPLLCV